MTRADYDTASAAADPHVNAAIAAVDDDDRSRAWAAAEAALGPLGWTLDELAAEAGRRIVADGEGR